MCGMTTVARLASPHQDNSGCRNKEFLRRGRRTPCAENTLNPNHYCSSAIEHRSSLDRNQSRSTCCWERTNENELSTYLIRVRRILDYERPHASFDVRDLASQGPFPPLTR